VLGALTGDAGFTSAQVGKINVTEFNTYVAVARDIAEEAQRRLAAGKVKGKSVKVRILEIPGDAQADAVSRANAGIKRRPKPVT